MQNEQRDKIPYLFPERLPHEGILPRPPRLGAGRCSAMPVMGRWLQGATPVTEWPPFVEAAPGPRAAERTGRRFHREQREQSRGPSRAPFTGLAGCREPSGVRRTRRG
jgi:hypothetical protein